jgi:uncharacterized protein (TIGR03066 family)
MRMLLGCGLLIVMGAVYSDDKVEKIDPKQLVGAWEDKDKARLEFTKDGKVFITPPGKKDKSEGTYKIDANKIKATFKLGKDDFTTTFTVTKLTDTELVFTPEDSKKSETLTRVKEK